MRDHRDSDSLTRMFEIMLKSSQVLSQSRHGVRQSPASSWNNYVYGNYQGAYWVEDEADIGIVGQLVQRTIDLVLFFIAPALLALIISLFFDTIGLDNFLKAHMIKAIVLLGSGFFTGVFIGLRIANEKGGMLTLFLGIGALIAFAYLVYMEGKGVEQISTYLPFFHGSAPPVVAISIPGAGLMGVILFKYFTIHHD